MSDIASPLQSCRQIEVGDLLCEWFSHLAGYAGEKPHFLSGWEVQPQGKPYDYDYFKWFKLIATQTPVSLRKEFLPQAAGVLTWEFRFQIPMLADGPAFALQAGDQDVLRLRVANSALMAVGSDGMSCQLTSVVAGRSYGVIARIDLTSRRVELQLDGRSVGVLPLASVGAPLDHIAITTGDGFVGDLFIGPILLHRGFALREQFLMCSSGDLPEGWSKVDDGGVVAVRRFGGAAHPVDALALCLEQVRVGPLSATAAFPALCGAVAVSAKWWIPQGGDGAALEVLDTAGTVVANITATDGDFTGGDCDKTACVLWRGWRSAVWYDLELIIDPATTTATCLINGITCGSFPIKCVNGIDALRLRSSGRGAATIWADHLCVRPHLPWPADYPAEPKPVTTGQTLVLMQSCDLWREGWHVGWDCIRKYPERRPLLGYYNGGDPEVEDWAITWMAENGIACDFKCWYRGEPGFPLHSLCYGAGLDGFKHARWSGKLHFAVNITNHFDMFTNLDDWRRHVIPYLIEHLFRDPRYLIIDGKPFLGIYDPHWLDRNTGDARVALDSLRQACCEAGFAGIWLVAQHRENETPKLADFARWGFDSVYAYTWYDRNAVQQQEQLLAHRAHGLIDILPTLSMGWDLRPWGGQQGLWLPAAEFQGLYTWAKHTYMPAAPSDAISRRVVMLDNWNEFGEGHSMMPCAGWGFAYLNAARDVFGQAPYPHNALPTPTQSARLDTLYPPGWRNGNT